MKVSDFVNNGNVDIEKLEKLIDRNKQLIESIKSGYFSVTKIEYYYRSETYFAPVEKGIVLKACKDTIDDLTLHANHYTQSIWYKLYKIFNK